MSSNDQPDATQDSTRSTGTATSRAGQAKRAVRKATKGRLALSGPSGSGKTWTALCIAEILAPGGRYVVIDTEPSDDVQSAATLYADRFTFDVIDWTEPPFNPRDLTLTIEDFATEGVDVLIVDSASAFWRGSGGTLDIADGRFGGWKVATPAQDAMIHAILKAPFHVIFCTRAKQAYEVEQHGDKQTVRKLGLAPIQRDDVEYEFQVVAMIDVEHRIDIGKTRCADLAGMSFHANQQGKLAEIYRDWLDRGLSLITQTDADLLRDALRLIEDKDERVAAASTFREQLGSGPNELEVDSLPAAWALVSAATHIDPHPFTPPAHDPATCSVCSLGRRAGWHEGVAAAVPVSPPQAAPGRRAVTTEPELPAEPVNGQEAATSEETQDVAHVPEAEARAALLAAKLQAERRQRFESYVLALPVGRVRATLNGLHIDEQGPPKQVRARLVEHYMAQAEDADAYAAASTAPADDAA